MGTEYMRVDHAEEVLTFSGKDSLLSHTIELLYDETGSPLLFFSDILTPVCIDNICKPMAVNVYWNLVGAYAGYGIYPEDPLTKFDHDLFEEADYAKLHELLLNPHSILERRKLSDLFDPEARPPDAERVTYKGQEVDAVSGATKKEIKESVVEGALYSCFTLWHLVHGDGVGKMSDYLEGIYSPELADYFLRSGYADYQMYAIKRLAEDDWERYLDRILFLFGEASPLTRRYILKKLPDKLWREDEVTQGLYGAFSSLDNNSKTLLVEQLALADPAAAGLLAPAATSMTRNQLRAYLAFLQGHPRQANVPSVREDLAKAAAEEDYAYGYLITAFLEGG